MTEKTYWIVKWKNIEAVRGKSSALGPRLYVSEKMARAKVRSRRSETNEQQDLNKEFIEVKLVEVSK